MLDGERVLLARVVHHRQAPRPLLAPPRATGVRSLALNSTARRVAPRVLLGGVCVKHNMYLKT